MAGNTFPMPFTIEADTAARAIFDAQTNHRNEIIFPRGWPCK